jgi:hypothetical protein
MMRTAWTNLVANSPGAQSRKPIAEEGAPSASDSGTLVMETLRSLVAPRRLVPILLVSLPLTYAQWHFSRSALELALGVALCVAFVFIAPVSWRVLFPEGLTGPGRAVRLLLYAAIAAGAVLTIGAAVPKLLGIGVTFMTARASLAICLALFLVGGWGLGRDIGFEHSLARERARAKALEREAERAQLLALRAQLDPHFLFNTLNSIAEWCREDGAVAERAVLQLSSILRSILEGVRSPSWPLSTELELVQTLLALHRLRDPGLFELELQLAADAGAIPVPPLVLLPLAENAVKHGPSAGHRGRIALSTQLDGETLRVRLENPGAFRGPRPGSAGLPTVERRLALVYRGEARLRLIGQGERTVAELELPRRGPDPGVVA